MPVSEDLFACKIRERGKVVVEGSGSEGWILIVAPSLGEK
jgi:hypothetical protein